MKTVLVLDDDRDFRDLIVPALAAKGLQVAQARTGAEATKRLEAGGVDLVVVDGLLPDTDGVQWIAKARASTQGREIPVVFISAFWRDLSSFNRLTKELRVVLVLHKPVSAALFAEEIDTLLEGREPPPAEPDSAPAPTPAPTAGAPTPAPASSPASAPAAASATPTAAPAAAPAVAPDRAARAAQALRALSADYARGLPAKAREIREALNCLRLDPYDETCRATARTLAHRLRGTAGSYGFVTVGEAAAAIEDALAEVLAPVPTPEAWSVLGSALEALEAAVAAIGPSTTEPEPGGVSLNSGRLLAVSRRSDFLEQVRALGRQQLYQVWCATSADEARAAAARYGPDAAFLDLPGPEAAQLSRELRAVPHCEGMALAFVSDAEATRDRVAAAHAGASLYLTRPVGSEDLSAAGRQLVAAVQVHRPRVLMVDDDEAFARRVRTVLEQKGFSVTHVSEPARLLEALEEAPPDLVLLDVVMPGVSGLDLCRVLRATPRWQDLPVVMLTAQAGALARTAAFQSGADDYLTKPVVDEELLARVHVRVERARLLRERYDKDALTGLLLRRPLIEGLRSRILEASRHERPLALAIVDFDHFKAVNDTHGHLAGDAVLAAFGKLLSRRFRAEDLRGRWGGEEFLLAFPGEARATMQGALERLLAEFSQVDFKADSGAAFRVGFCVGIASFPEDGESLEDLIRSADRRLYAAKREGGAKVVSQP